jgi:hypothetical protein
MGSLRANILHKSPEGCCSQWLDKQAFRPVGKPHSWWNEKAYAVDISRKGSAGLAHIAYQSISGLKIEGEDSNASNVALSESHFTDGANKMHMNTPKDARICT